MYTPPEYIYKLLDPRDRSVRYVGRTMHPHDRLVNHLSCKLNEEKYKWVCELKLLGLTPIMVILDAIIFEPDMPRKESAGGREAYWIKLYKDQGEPLFNKTPAWEKRSRHLTIEYELSH